MKKSTAASKGQGDRFYFQCFEGILKSKGDVLNTLLKEKVFEKAHNENVTSNI